MRKTKGQSYERKNSEHHGEGTGDRHILGERIGQRDPIEWTIDR